VIASWIPMANHASADPVKIMPLGDSITSGNNDINFPNGDIPGGYRKELETRLSGAGYLVDFIGSETSNPALGFDPDHQGHPGFRTDELIAGLPTWLPAGPDTILLMAGTNDILQNVAVATAAANLDNLILQIAAASPECRIYVATIIPIAQDWRGQSAAVLNANADLFNMEVRTIVQQHASQNRKVTLVDMSQLITLTDEDPLKNFYQPGDGIHPGQAGYDQLGLLWFNAITAGGNLIDPPPEGVPAVPSALQASVASPSRVNLAWTDNAGDETLHQIRRTVGTSGIWQVVADLPANTVNHAITGITTGTDFHGFSVRAGNSAGWSAWSPSVFTPDFGDLAHTRPATASSSFNSSTTPDRANDGLTTTLWASTGVASHYWQVDLTALHHIQRVTLHTRQDFDVEVHRKNFEIRASEDPSFATYTVLGNQGATAIPFKGTWEQDIEIPDAFRHLRVAKTDGQSFSIALLQVHGSDEVGIPCIPQNPQVIALDSQHIRIQWTPASVNEAGFIIERKTGEEGVYQEIARMPAASSSYVDSGLVAETSYHYRISAFNESGGSEFSAVVSTVTGMRTGYDQWAFGYPLFLAMDPTEQDPSADANVDGIINILSFAACLDPLQTITSDSVATMIVEGSSQAYFRFRRNKFAPDLEYDVMVSTDLSDSGWSMLDLSSATVAEIPGEPGVEQVNVPMPPNPGNTCRFAKLRVRLD
jgi:lysophospholipase L1-like esterase